MLSEYNIDALKQEDGTFKDAGFALIKGAIECGHTAHLQTERGVVAFRPYEINEVRVNQKTGVQYFAGEEAGKNILVEFFSTASDSSIEDDSIRMPVVRMYDLSRGAYKKLHGSMDTQYKANDYIAVYCNQAYREGYVLATIGDEMIVEFEMPGTAGRWGYNRRTGQYRHDAAPTSALRVVQTIGRVEVGTYKPYSYNSVPKKWLKAIREAGMTQWIGMGQRSLRRIPFPAS